MKNQLSSILLIGLIAVVAACGSGKSELEAKKEELKKLESEVSSLNLKINQLKKEILAADSTALRTNDILVSTFIPGRTTFARNLEFRSSVESDRNVTISAESMGRIVSLPATEGKRVSSGQVLASVDAAVIQSNLKQVNTQLELATSVYERQKNLWDQQIGTEIQYLEAKSNKEALESQRSALLAQLRMARVTAPFSGTVDAVFVKLGEMVQPGMPIVRVVNPSEMYLSADISEAYLGKFNAGDEVMVKVVGQEEVLQSEIKSVGNVINPQNRTFELEVTLPKSKKFEYRPNQVAVITVADYVQENAVQVPSKIILTGADSKFIYVVKEQDGKRVAEKRTVTIGKTSEGMTEILSGLDGTEQVIDKGYREVSDGASIKIQEDQLVATK